MEYQEQIRQRSQDGWRLVQAFAPGTGAYEAAKYFDSRKRGLEMKWRSPHPYQAAYSVHRGCVPGSCLTPWTAPICRSAGFSYLPGEPWLENPGWAVFALSDMNADSFAPHPERVPDTQSSPDGGPPNPPPRPPKLTARALLDPGEPQHNILIGEVVVVKELAALLGLKPFMVVADVMAIGQFKNPDESIDFSTAASVARKHGYLAEKNF